MVLSNYGRELLTRPNEDTTKVETVVAKKQENEKESKKTTYNDRYASPYISNINNNNHKQ